MRKRYFSLVAILVLLGTGKLFIGSSPDGSTSTYEGTFREHYNIFALNLPNRIEFCGERVPMEDHDVRERLDRELHVNTYWQSNTLLLIKRSNRYLGIITPILKKHGIPEDFKYLPIIESGFSEMVSPAGAEGPWQFMESTAKIYNLEVSSDVDERYHLEKATEAACKYFKDAYKIFGNWTAVAASYNVGMAGLRNSMERQKVTSYYDASLNSQTARYVFRILAIKELMENPDRYGFHYQKKHLYQPVSYRTVKVDSSIKSLTDFAKSHFITYKTLKELNPWLKGYKLDNPGRRTYYLRIPKNVDPDAFTVEEDTPVFSVPVAETKLAAGKEEKKNVPAKEFVTVDKVIKHTVKEGENINDIAKKYEVKIPELLEWNNLDEPVVEKGQILKIYRIEPERNPGGKKQKSGDHQDSEDRKR